jgi:hypothetical protein
MILSSPFRPPYGTASLQEFAFLAGAHDHIRSPIELPDELVAAHADDPPIKDLAPIHTLAEASSRPAATSRIASPRYWRALNALAAARNDLALVDWLTPASAHEWSHDEETVTSAPIDLDEKPTDATLERLDDAVELVGAL